MDGITALPVEETGVPVAIQARDHILVEEEEASTARDGVSPSCLAEAGSRGC